MPATPSWRSSKGAAPGTGLLPSSTYWLAGGWSSHFEFADTRARRVRCDFVSRPPRVPRAALEQLFAPASTPPARAADVSTLPLRRAHERLVEMAERMLPRTVDREDARADAQ